MRHISKIRVYSPSKAHRAAFVRNVSKNIGVPAIADGSAEEVARRSDVLVLATSSNAPPIRGYAVRPGTHVNAIGAALPDSREMDASLVKRSVLVVDSVERALATYGDIIIPLKEKSITRSHIKAELGELVLDPSMIERRKNDVTVFKAGGLGALGAVFADYIVSQHSVLGKSNPR